MLPKYQSISAPISNTFLEHANVRCEEAADCVNIAFSRDFWRKLLMAGANKNIRDVTVPSSPRGPVSRLSDKMLWESQMFTLKLGPR